MKDKIKFGFVVAIMIVLIAIAGLLVVMALHQTWISDMAVGFKALITGMVCFWFFDIVFGNKIDNYRRNIEEREETKHGYWIGNTDCSVCGWSMHDDVAGGKWFVNFKFCPNCGSKMNTNIIYFGDIKK